MKKNNIELRIYELLGVKVVQKIVLLNAKYILRVKKDNENPGTYFIGKLTYENMNVYKKGIFANAAIHIVGALFCMYHLFPVASTAFVVGTILNLYLVMLQRYNYIKLKRVMNTIKPRYERKREELKNDILETDSKIKEHEYSIMTSKDKEKVIDIDTIINKSSLDDLKKMSEFLKNFEENEYDNDKYAFLDFQFIKLHVK